MIEMLFPTTVKKKNVYQNFENRAPKTYYISFPTKSFKNHIMSLYHYL